MNQIETYRREFVSFSGKCPYSCLHCYTFTPEYHSIGEDSIAQIVDNLKGANPDVIYISGHKENFISPNKGLELGEKLFETYHCDIMMTTRNVFFKSDIDRLSNLNSKMRVKGRNLFFCVSIPALDSYKKLENNQAIPTPQQRIEFLEKVYAKGIDTFLTIKPLCPNEFIPIEEILQIVEECKAFSTVVLSSGIVVNNHILKRLKDFPLDFKSFEAPLMTCLENDIVMQYVDVSEELTQIESLCDEYSIPFFQHSMPAIKYVKSLRNDK